MHGRNEYASFEKALGRTVSILILMFGLVLAAFPARGDPQTEPMRREPGRDDAAAGASDAWMAAAQKTIADREYHVNWQDAPSLRGHPASWQAANRRHRFRTFFTDASVRMVPRQIQGELPPWDLSFELSAYGRGSSSLDIPRGQVTVADGRIEIDRGTVIEWYVNEAAGLKQGFTLPAPPEASGADGLARLDLILSGNLSARHADDGRAIDFIAPGGARVLRYADLVVVDYAGRELPASMEVFAALEGTILRLAFDDADAVYPVTVDPLMTSPAWTAESDQYDARLGWRSASAGDVNGDGYSDVIAGSHVWDNGEATEGAAFVWYGSASGLSATPSWTVEGQQIGAGMGWSVGSAGDVNGDGYADVIVGAWQYDDGQVDEGGVFVYYGSASGLAGGPVAGPADADWMFETDQANARLGSWVGSAGDVNGDGYSDLVASAHLMDDGETDEGIAFIFYGSASGPAGGPSATPADADWSMGGDQVSAQLGYSLSGAGDVNGDGYSDLLIGAYIYDSPDTDGGAAFLFNGSAAGLPGGPVATPTDASWRIESDQAEANLGISVGAAGDLNGDGYADIVVAARGYTHGEVDEGKVFVFHGSPTGPAGGPLATPADADWNVRSDQAGAHLGHASGTAGDVDGDGYADLVVSAWLYDNGQSDEGAVFLFRGSPAGLAGGPAATVADADWSFESDQAGARLGSSAGAAGDVNGDGYGDLLVGAYLYANGLFQEGRVFAFMGSGTVPAGGPSALLGDADWTWESDQTEAYLGYGRFAPGDINGDGFDDVAVGTPFYDNGESDEGMVFIFPGSTAGASTVPAWTIESDVGGVRLGWAVDAAGDVNGDGYADVVVGVPRFSNGQAYEGGVFLFPGSPSGLQGGPASSLADASWSVESNMSLASLGVGVFSNGDLNGDGIADIAITVPNYSGPEVDEGLVAVFYGTQAGPAGGPVASLADSDWEVQSDTASAYLGLPNAVSMGDVDGDGLSDLVVGCAYCDLSVSGGKVDIFKGSGTGLPGGPSATRVDATWSVAGEQASSYFGYYISADGDINGDGFDDLMVGSVHYSNGQSDEGAVFLFPGSAAGITATTAADATWRIEGNLYWGNLSTPAFAGDVNGDGFDDLMVGSPYRSTGIADEGSVMLFLGAPSGPRGGPVADPSDADVRIDGGIPNARLGLSPPAAGDVNGDGFSDIVLTAPYWSQGQYIEGAVAIFFGNGGPGDGRAPQQRRPSDLAPIARLGSAYSQDSFRLAMTGLSPAGRDRVKLQWELKTADVPFDGTGLEQSSSWSDTGTAGADLNELIGGLGSSTLYRWRARLLYHPAGDATQPAGRWMTAGARGWTAPSFRTADGTADLSVSLSDSADPILTGDLLTYTIDVGNAGPVPTNVTLFQDLDPSSSFVSATPSQGGCADNGGQITCSLGAVPSGGAAQVQVAVTPGAAVLLSSSVSLISTAAESNPIDNDATETTLARHPALGNLIWEDLDGDGIQDAGEPGLADVLVAVYDGAGILQGATVSDPNGNYSFPGLALGGDYFAWIGAPPGYSFTAANAGSDDMLDSDVDPLLFTTPVITLQNGDDPIRWDAGLILSCVVPDEPIYLYNMTMTIDGNDYPVLHFQDANQAAQITGYNVRRSSDASIPRASWPLVATDVVDMDEAIPNKQWVDISGDVSPTGVWYYLVSAFNGRCAAEGPLN